MSSTGHIYHRAASRLGDKFDRSMTRGKLLDNKPTLFHFYFLNNNPFENAFQTENILYERKLMQWPNELGPSI